MIGSQTIAGWVTHVVFWSVVGLGLLRGELTARIVGISIGLWMLGTFRLPRLDLYVGDVFVGAFVTPYLAALDIILVFLVFKGDVNLT